MATTSYGTPYVQSSDLVSGWPTASLNVADRIDAVSYAGNGLNAQTGTTYTLVVGDAGKTITLNNAAAVAVTLPQDSVANLPTGAVVNFYNLGAGTVTISAGAGATLQGSSIVISQYGFGSVIKLSANTYGKNVGANIPNNGSAKVTTNQTTTSTTFTDLATVGPQVTVTTGTKAFVIINAWLRNSNAAQVASTSFAVSGATTLAASADDAITLLVTGAYVPYGRFATGFIVTGLTAGSNTFTMKYRASGGTAEFESRTISVIDMGS